MERALHGRDWTVVSTNPESLAKAFDRYLAELKEKKARRCKTLKTRVVRVQLWVRKRVSTPVEYQNCGARGPGQSRSRKRTKCTCRLDEGYDAGNQHTGSDPA